MTHTDPLLTGEVVEVNATTLVLGYECGCRMGEFQDGDTCGDCERCKLLCPQGSRFAAACTGTSDLVCAACEDGTFQALTAHTSPNCDLCTATCPEGQFIATECSAIADTVCATCTACEAFERESSACGANNQKDDRVCVPSDERAALLDYLEAHQTLSNSGWNDAQDHCQWPVGCHWLDIQC